MKPADESAFRTRMGEHVRALRLARELTQVRFAEQCDVSPDTVRRLELGLFSPSITTLRAVTGGLGISLGTFFSSLESGERLVEREIIDLLANRSPDERRMVLRVVLALFGSDGRALGRNAKSTESDSPEPTACEPELVEPVAVALGIDQGGPQPPQPHPDPVRNLLE